MVRFKDKQTISKDSLTDTDIIPITDMEDSGDDKKVTIGQLREYFGGSSETSGVHIVEDFISSDNRSWYRVWSDGIVEQGGESVVFPKNKVNATFLVNLNHSLYPVHIVYTPNTIDAYIFDEEDGLGENADYYAVNTNGYITWKNTKNLSGFTIYNTGNVIFSAIWYARGKKA